MAVIAKTRGSSTGQAWALGATNAGGDSFYINDPATQFHMKNPTGAPITVTFVSSQPCNFGVVGGAHSWAIVMAAGAEAVVGPFPFAQFNDGTGKCQVTYSAAGITAAVI